MLTRQVCLAAATLILAVGLVGAQAQPSGESAIDGMPEVPLWLFVTFELVNRVIFPALIGAAYVATAWWVARRFGERWLWATCIVAALLLLTAIVLRGSPSPQLSHFPIHAASLASGPVICATLSVRRRLRASAGGALTRRSTKAGVVAWFAGLFVGLIPAIAMDLAAKFR
jgi:hypothetical protein